MTIDNAWALPEWPYAFGKPGVSASLRFEPEDFEVEELPAVEPSGQGSHLWLWVEKTGANTDWVAGQLARIARCSPHEVGYAGMKDRHAVTRQWFSIPWPAAKSVPHDATQEAQHEEQHGEQNGEQPEAQPEAQPEEQHVGQQAPGFGDPGIEGVRILRVKQNEKKLRRGILRGNQFRIRLRHLQGDLSGLESRLNQIAELGVPNYFGPQRFGFGGANVERAMSWLQQGGRIPRAKRSIYLSALRSFLFNQVLAERVRSDSWNRLLEGELCMLDGSHSIFLGDPLDEVLQQRCRDFDLHPTAPMPGRGGMATRAAVHTLEQTVLLPYAEAISSLERFGVDGERRSLRLRVRELKWELQQDALLLEFSLPAGAYATVVLRELVNE